MHYLEGILRYLKDEWTKKKGGELPDADEWNLVFNTNDTPRQQNDNDCGVFICLYAYFLSLDYSLAFSQIHATMFRDKLALYIMMSSSPIANEKNKKEENDNDSIIMVSPIANEKDKKEKNKDDKIIPIANEEERMKQNQDGSNYNPILSPFTIFQPLSDLGYFGWIPPSTKLSNLNEATTYYFKDGIKMDSSPKPVVSTLQLNQQCPIPFQVI